MFVEYHVPDSKAVIRNLVYKFMQRLDKYKLQSRIRRHWIKMLYIHNSFCLNVPLCNVFFLYLPCAILLYFSSHLHFFNVYVDICMYYVYDNLK